MRRLKLWLATIGTILVLGTTFWAVYLVRDHLPVLGLVILISIGVLFGAGTIFLLCAALLLLVRWSVQFKDVGQHGTLVHHWRDGMKQYNPQIVDSSTTDTKRIDRPRRNVAPSIRSMLESGIIREGHVILGFHENGEPRIGDWGDLRTFIIAGTSRSGKTVGLFFLLIQALVNRCQVYICDAHYQKASSITNLMRPLGNFVKFALTQSEIIELVSEFGRHLEHRGKGLESTDVPKILALDEWNEYMANPLLAKQIVSIVEEISRAGAGYNLYVVLVGQIWQPSRSGGRSITGSVHAKLCYRLDPAQSQHLFRGYSYARTAMLDTGDAVLLDTSGVFEQLSMPLGDVRDAVWMAHDFSLYSVEEENSTARVDFEPPAVVDGPDIQQKIDQPKSELDIAFECYSNGAVSRESLAKAMSLATGIKISPHKAELLKSELRGAGKI